jgi:hypothetical protein
MTTYANVTEEEMAAILAQLEHKVLKDIKLPERPGPLVCKFAIDTGERAFANLPCRGNRIICQKIEGHISYATACNPGSCKFFEPNR